MNVNANSNSNASAPLSLTPARSSALTVKVPATPKEGEEEVCIDSPATTPTTMEEQVTEAHRGESSDSVEMFLVKRNVKIDLKYINTQELADDLVKYINSEVDYVSDQYINLAYTQDVNYTLMMDSISNFSKHHLARIWDNIKNLLNPSSQIDEKSVQVASSYFLSKMIMKVLEKTMHG